MRIGSWLRAGVLGGLFPVTIVAQGAGGSGYADAEALIRRGEWDKGMALLAPVIEADRGSPKAHNLMGIALMGKGEFARANEHFRLALKRDPRFHPALKNLAISELNQNDLGAAERHFREALELAPNDPVIHMYLGEFAYGRREYKQAAFHLGEAEAFVLSDPNLLLHLVDSYFRTGREVEATDLIKGLEGRELDPGLQFQVALMLGEHGRFAEAASWFLRIRQRFPESYNVGFNLAVCYLKAKQYGEAITVLNDLHQRGHRTGEVYHLLAEAYEANQQVQQAIDALREAVALDPANPENYGELAALCIDHEA